MIDRLRYLGLKWRALFWLTLGCRQRASALFLQMRDEYPRDAYALASQAHLLAQAGRRTEALRLMDLLIEVEPVRAAHWFNRGFLLEELGELAQAETSLRRATELDPGLDRAWYGLGLVLIRLGRLDEAVPVLKKNTQLQPMSPYGWYQLARVHMDRQEPDEARRIIAHLKSFEPKVAAQLERETGIVVSSAS